MDTRYCSRLMIVNEQEKLLLFQYKDEHKPAFWATAGGELKGNETYLDAAKRELYEETGLSEKIGDLVYEREDIFAVARSAPAIWKEKYYLVSCTSEAEVYAAQWTEEENCTIQKWKWWSLVEMKEQKVTFLPECLPDLLAKILANTPNT